MFGITLEKKGLSRTRQLCDQLRKLIGDGSIPAAARLHGTRQAAREIGVGRNTVIEAYEQLTAEGYLESRRGSGTYVARMGARGPRKNVMGAAVTRRLTPAGPPPSAGTLDRDVIDFDRASGTPDTLAMPVKTWASCLRRAAESASLATLTYAGGRDDPQLQEVLASYLFRQRGIDCDPRRLLITNGFSNGLLLIGLFFSTRFSSAYVEDPTLPTIRSVLMRVGYRIHPIPVDAHGAQPRVFGAHRGLVVLTPSHQFPTGNILSAPRRMEFLRLVQKTGSLIVEDDYDGEFRYRGMPVPSLVTLDDRQVILASTFSKTMFPSLRLGFLVVPADLADAMERFRRECTYCGNLIEQRALALFIAEGHFERHVRRMKKLYESRKTLIEQELRRTFSDKATITGNAAGMHLVVQLDTATGRGLDWSASRSFGLRVSPLRDYVMGRSRQDNRIVLGFGNLSDEKIVEGIQRLARFTRMGKRLQIVGRSIKKT